MEVLHFEGSDDTPAITLDKRNGIFEISGRSLPEDSAVFYEPVLKWIELYKKEPNVNTASRLSSTIVIPLHQNSFRIFS